MLGTEQHLPMDETMSLKACISTAIIFLATTPSLFSQTEFQPKTLIPKPFPAIKNAPSVEADDPSNDVRDDELVLGVQIGKQARAYPINMLNGPRREIINDKLGNRDIAATW